MEIVSYGCQDNIIDGDLLQEIYMLQPEGFIVTVKETKVCKLRKTLHDLKQALRAWYTNFDSYLWQQGLHRSNADYKLYYLIENGRLLLLVLYVNDLLITGNHTLKIEWLKTQLQSEFEMTDLREMSSYLMNEFHYLKQGIFMSQLNYTEQLLEEFQMLTCNSCCILMDDKQKLKEMNAAPVDVTLYCDIVVNYYISPIPDQTSVL